jgi:hypothetical protein
LLPELDASDPIENGATKSTKRARVTEEETSDDGFLMHRASTEVTEEASCKKPHESTSNSHVEHLRAVASKERKLARHMPMRAPTPKPHHRGLPFHRLTPGLPKSSRHRSASAGPKTPASTHPAPIERPTVRRKKTWKKAMQSMVDYT